MKYIFILITFLSCLSIAHAQNSSISGLVHSDEKPVPFATVSLLQTTYGTTADSTGRFVLSNIPAGRYELQVSALGFQRYSKFIEVRGNKSVINQDIALISIGNTLDEVVVTGTMKEVSKLESAVPVEIYTPQYFRRNPTPSFFDAMQLVNGVRPQLNCNVCNTGDIHINGLEGPYTMVLLDGMPIVSSLATVYGLSGIPNSLVERIEVIKGPASTLYGSEAVGGLINIITKNPAKAPIVSADVFGTTWMEANVDLGIKTKVGKRAQSLIGINYYNFDNVVDHNKDGFTDMTLQKRISVFNKWSFQRKDNRLASIAARYFYEDRWGGETHWSPADRGGDEVYGESIYTHRAEVIGVYQLPVRENLMFRYSYNFHDQNSYYGDTPYMATQHVAFGQLTWDKKIHSHDLLAGAALRYTKYSDNTPATAEGLLPQRITLPGVFVQDEISLSAMHKLMLGMRYDYNSVHGSVVTPRVAYKWTLDPNSVLRLNGGTGYRVANVFTEDHAALTGARDVIFREALRPERSWNANLNYTKRISFDQAFVGLDASAFYTYFTNKIFANYDINPNQIIYENLRGYAVSQGVSLNVDVVFPFPLKIIAGATFMDVYNVQENDEGYLERSRQLFAERITGTWSVSYAFQKIGLSVDYTGNIYGPMRLPLLSDLDPRPEYSPVWSLQNIQLTKDLGSRWQLYGGIKNLLNWTPDKATSFLISRPNDPFDKNVTFDTNGQVVVTPDNPYGLTFDPSYVYAPMQGRRAFLGLRYTLR